MSITIKEKYNPVYNRYDLYATNLPLGARKYIGSSNVHRCERERETFMLEQKLNGNIL